MSFFSTVTAHLGWATKAFDYLSWGARAANISAPPSIEVKDDSLNPEPYSVAIELSLLNSLLKNKLDIKADRIDFDPPEGQAIIRKIKQLFGYKVTREYLHEIPQRLERFLVLYPPEKISGIRLREKNSPLDVLNQQEFPISTQTCLLIMGGIFKLAKTYNVEEDELKKPEPEQNSEEAIKEPSEKKFLRRSYNLVCEALEGKLPEKDSNASGEQFKHIYTQKDKDDIVFNIREAIKYTYDSPMEKTFRFQALLIRDRKRLEYIEIHKQMSIGIQPKK